MKIHIVIAVVLLSGFSTFVGCTGPKAPMTPVKTLTSEDMCGAVIAKMCNSCSPQTELLRVKLNTYSPLVVTEVKNCIDLSLLGSVKDRSVVDAKIKACVENSIGLNSEIVQMIKTTLDGADTREEQFQVWLQCYKDSMRRKPTVVVMDQPNNDELVYCPDTRKIKASNAYDIDNLLRKLDRPLNILQVPTHLAWQNEQQVIDAEPALVIIHASAFYEKTQAMEGNKKLIAFLNSLKGTNIKVLVYTRGLEDQAPEDVQERWKRIQETVGGNVELFVMPKGHGSCFTDSEVGMPFRQKIREMLAL